jgi:hypothetical protein
VAIIPFGRRKPGACAVCGDWPEASREATRLLIDVMPPHARICDECLMVCWERLFAGELTSNGAKRPRY